MCPALDPDFTDIGRASALGALQQLSLSAAVRPRLNCAALQWLVVGTAGYIAPSWDIPTIYIKQIVHNGLRSLNLKLKLYKL